MPAVQSAFSIVVLGMEKGRPTLDRQTNVDRDR